MYKYTRWGDVADDAVAKQVDSIEEEANDILTNIHSKNTANFTKFAVKLKGDYCLAKERDVEFENLTMSELWTYLKGFYFKNGKQHD